MRRDKLSVLLISAAVVVFAAAPALPQGSADWQLPSGFVPAPQPSRPLATVMVGPIRFDEAEFPFTTVVNGLSVSTVGGAALPGTLAFSFSSADAAVLGGPGTITYVDDPSIEGDANGTLTIDFGVDVTRVAFGFAQNCAAPSTPSVTVTAMDSGGGVVDSTTVTGQDFGFFFLENQVDFSPASPARTVEVTFDTSGGDCFRFALDNLGYDALVVPTMKFLAAAALLLSLLVLGAAALHRAGGT